MGTGTVLEDGARLAALRDSGALDPQARVAFERLNRLAVELLGVPVSLVSLVAWDRQVFAGQIGLPDPWASLGETPLSHSFCQHVVERAAPLVVQDARAHPQLRANLAIRDLSVVAYAGVPLQTAEGQVLGSFCAIDAQPRQWTERDLDVLGDLAALARDVIELHRLRLLQPLRDALTGLLSRRLFDELAARALQDTGRVTVVALDLDGFALVNEALGHPAGDELLVAVAERLAGALPEGAIACRLAADTFLAACHRPADAAGAEAFAVALRDAVTGTPLTVAGRDQAVRATVASAFAVAPSSPAILIAEALDALDAARAGTRDRPADAPSRRITAPGRLDIRDALVGAQERGELRTVYQPIVDLQTGRAVGVEALLRWTHPRLGEVAPDAFVPVAEASGAIVRIGEWVLRTACRDLATLRAARPDLTLAVNVAPVQLRAPSLAEQVAGALADAGLPASALTLEITERALLDEQAVHRRTMDAVRALGVRLALDDFGTGYSALSYLARLPIDLLKLDRTFVAELPSDPRAGALVTGILALTRGLGMATVAEGIETEAQREQLAAAGCSQGQGYLFARPLEADALADALG